MLLSNIFLMSSALLGLTSRAAKSVEMIILSRILVGINAGMCTWTITAWAKRPSDLSCSVLVDV